MQKELLIQAGEAVFGSQWQTELSQSLDVSSRTMRYWVSGERQVPKLENDLIEILNNRITLINQTIEQLKKESTMKINEVAFNEFVSETKHIRFTSDEIYFDTVVETLQKALTDFSNKKPSTNSNLTIDEVQIIRLDQIKTCLIRLGLENQVNFKDISQKEMYEPIYKKVNELADIIYFAKFFS